ncbi:hypothetical protein EJB05_04795, partial [Eragrostis curvula]
MPTVRCRNSQQAVAGASAHQEAAATGAVDASITQISIQIHDPQGPSLLQYKVSHHNHAPFLLCRWCRRPKPAVTRPLKVGVALSGGQAASDIFDSLLSVACGDNFTVQVGQPLPPRAIRSWLPTRNSRIELQCEDVLSIRFISTNVGRRSMVVPSARRPPLGDLTNRISREPQPTVSDEEQRRRDEEQRKKDKRKKISGSRKKTKVNMVSQLETSFHDSGTPTLASSFIGQQSDLGTLGSTILQTPYLPDKENVDPDDPSDWLHRSNNYVRRYNQMASCLTSDRGGSSSKDKLLRKRVRYENMDESSREILMETHQDSTDVVSGPGGLTQAKDVEKVIHLLQVIREPNEIEFDQAIFEPSRPDYVAEEHLEDTHDDDDFESFRVPADGVDVASSKDAYDYIASSEDAYDFFIPNLFVGIKA